VHDTGAAPPDPDVLRAAPRKTLNQGANAGEPDEDELRALTWMARASRPVSALDDPSVAADVLDALARKLDGSPASPSYFSRRRRVVHRALGYAVRKKRLSANPLSKASQPEGWTPPEAPDDALDYRAIGSPELVESMIEICRTLGSTQGARFRAFYGCMYFSMMRPSEVAALMLSACELPEDGWGWLTIADASPTAGRAYTDDGQAHEHRGLKGRTRGRPGTRARKPSRRIPAPPELVAMLREHIARFGAGPDGRIFRSERGNPINASTWWQVWHKVRAASLTPEQLDGPLMRRPYDLRHPGGSTRAWTRRPSRRGPGTRWKSCAASTTTRSAARNEVLIARMDAHRRQSLWGRIGDRIRHSTASEGNAWHWLISPRFTSSQVRGRFPLVKRSAPSRIRTCAHGSGGRCSIP
jgi:integrase